MYRPEDNEDLTIRRLDGSFFKAALPTWFDEKCHMISGDVLGKMKTVYIVPPMGATVRLNPNTRRFESFKATAREEEIIDIQMKAILNEAITKARLAAQEVEDKKWFNRVLKKVKRITCQK